jgi:phospholipid/cholesterol/gamma-HCH transport system substrate-binding protein
METRSNWLKVSLVVGLLITAVIGFTLWLIQSREADGATYEVQFKQSVDGVQIGSGVNLLGVPVGKVTQVRLQPSNPDTVVVRFVLTKDILLHRGVTASVDKSFFDGSAEISLAGSNKREPALTVQAGQPFPLVPVKTGDLNPDEMIAKISSGAESISKKLDPAGQRSIEERLGQLALRTRNWKSDVSQIAGEALQEDRIHSLGNVMARAGDDAERLRLRLEASRGGLRDSLVRPLHDAEGKARSLGLSISHARPRIRQLEGDAQQIAETARAVREPVRRVGDAAKKIDREGVGSPKLPDYRPTTEERK